MSEAANGSRYRQVLLETVRGISGNGSRAFDPMEVMRQTLNTLGIHADENLKSAILCCFNDLLRTGLVGLGDPRPITNLVNAPPWPHGVCHVTPEGKETLKHAS